MPVMADRFQCNDPLGHFLNHMLKFEEKSRMERVVWEKTLLVSER